MPVNVDDKKGAIVTSGAGFKRNGTTVISTAAEINEIYMTMFISSLASGASFCVFPFAGEITGGYSCTSANPGTDPVITISCDGGSTAAGTFTITASGAGISDSLSLGAGTKTFSAGAKITATVTSGAGNAVPGFFTLIAKRT